MLGAEQHCLPLLVFRLWRLPVVWSWSLSCQICDLLKATQPSRAQRWSPNTQKERSCIPDCWKKGREVNVVLVPQHQFGSCSFTLVVNQPLSEATCCRSGEKEDSWSWKKKTKSKAKGHWQHYQSWINKCFLWLSWKWVHVEIVAWCGERETQPSNGCPGFCTYSLL